MLSSFKARFIFIYLILILICMAIVGTFLINRLEVSQMKTIEGEVNETIDSMVASAGYLQNSEWGKEVGFLQNTIDGWQLSSTESIYTISEDQVPVVLASLVNLKDEIQGQNALAQRDLSPEIVLEALEGHVSETTILESNQALVRRLAKPTFSANG